MSLPYVPQLTCTHKCAQTGFDHPLILELPPLAGEMAALSGPVRTLKTAKVKKAM